jgi:acetone carboxylase gamma subunit
MKGAKPNGHPGQTQNFGFRHDNRYQAIAQEVTKLLPHAEVSVPQHYDTRRWICAECGQVPRKRSLLIEADGIIRCVARSACTIRRLGL